MYGMSASGYQLMRDLKSQEAKKKSQEAKKKAQEKAYQKIRWAQIKHSLFNPNTKKPEDTLATVSERNWPKNETWFKFEEFLSAASDCSDQPNKNSEEAAVPFEGSETALEMRCIYR
jgi:hypothetical protein